MASNTEDALLRQFGAPVAPLVDVCEKYFGLSPRVAVEHALLNKLPVPTFRLRDSTRSPMMIHVRDLAQYIDDVHSAATEHWEHSQV